MLNHHPKTSVALTQSSVVAGKKNNCKTSVSLILGNFYCFIMQRGITLRFDDDEVADVISQEQLDNMKWLQ